MNPNKKVPEIAKLNRRLLQLSYTVKECLEPECKLDDFIEDKFLGRGAFGEVWKVQHITTGKIYVYKKINKRVIIEMKLDEQLNREISIMYSINHPLIIKLINHFEDDEFFYLIMDFIPKGLYYELNKVRAFSTEQAAHYIYQVVRAVEYIHNLNPPVIHRDIKPENILVTNDNNILLADFGWSNYLDGVQVRKTLCGTPEYVSPEILKRVGHGTEVDIWALGILLYELLYGYSPFKDKNKQIIYANIKSHKIVYPDNNIDPLAKNLIEKMIKHDPSERIKIDQITEHAFFKKYLNPNKSNEVIVKFYKNPPEKYILISNPDPPPKVVAEPALRRTNRDSLLDGSSFIEKNTKELINSYECKINDLEKENLQLKEQNTIINQQNEKLNEKLKDYLNYKNNKEHELKNDEIRLNNIKIALLAEKEEHIKELTELKEMLREKDRYIDAKATKITILSNELTQVKEKNVTYETKIKSLMEELENQETVFKEKNLSLLSQINLIQNKILQVSEQKMEYSNQSIDSMCNDIIISNLVKEPIFNLKMLVEQKTESLSNILINLERNTKIFDSKQSDIIHTYYLIITDTIKRIKSDMETRLLNMELGLHKKENKELEDIKLKNSMLLERLHSYEDIKNSHLKLTIEKEGFNEKIKALKENKEAMTEMLNLKNNIVVSLQERLHNQSYICQALEDKLGELKHFIIENYNSPDLLDQFVSKFNSINKYN